MKDLTSSQIRLSLLSLTLCCAKQQAVLESLISPKLPGVEKIDASQTLKDAREDIDLVIKILITPDEEKC